MRNASAGFARWFVVVWAIVGFCVATTRAEEPKKVDLRVKGAGLLRNLELRAALIRLLDTKERTTLDANGIEDAAVILWSTLGEHGFQRPVIQIEVTGVDGAERRVEFDPTFARALPRPLEAKAVTFQITTGVRYYVDDVRFNGLTVMTPKEGRAFFRSDSALFANARTNAFSPSKVSRAADALLTDLRQRGYAQAEVKAQPRLDDATGKVTVDVEVHEGPRWVVADMVYQREDDDRVVVPDVALWVGKPWSATLQEDIREAIRQTYYREGFPDVGVHVAAEAEEASNGERNASVFATTVPGEPVTVGDVRFEGNAHTREGVLRRRVRLDSGEPLNLVALERARYRISRLGVFETVDLRYEPEDGPRRDPIYRVREAPRYETSLLLGYGSYEQLRGGVEHRQKNLFGLAHQSRLEVVQSMKSTSGDYTYTVPELFGESLDGTVRLFGLQRQEIAFLRQEFGVDASLKRILRPIRGEATLGYTFQALRNRENELSTRELDNRQLNVASVNFGLTSDWRDNPLRPRRGFHWTAQIEAADPRLAGQATYQRYEFSGAYHTSWGDGRWIHFGLSHGAITTLGSDGTTLPVNKRFYPGGDNSIRGYQRGEAAPRDADGLFVGAKVQLLANLELEQALTPNWSVVLFGDALGMAESIREYPYDETLFSVGLGIRYQTLIGPVRLEYGRNIDPRPGDPSGTWHFSIGYPF